MLYIKSPRLAGLEKKTVSHSQPLQMANDAKIKIWLLSRDQIQSAVRKTCLNIKPFVKAS